MKVKILFLALLMQPFLQLGKAAAMPAFCTMGAMKPDQPYSKKVQVKLRSMDLSFYRGTTTLTPVVYVATADLNFSINHKSSFQIKLPYQAVTGRLANTAGMGDISLCYTRNLYRSDPFDINFSLGTKLPTNDSDKNSPEGFPLPMYYQTSLGTYDAIAGFSLMNRKWLFATGIQIPLTRNNNQFLWSRWAASDEDPVYIQKYARANQLRRATDIMLRAERNFRLARFNMSVGVLPIYRIYRDEFLDAQGIPVREAAAQGLAALRNIHSWL